jgi:hypothetical protein
MNILQQTYIDNSSERGRADFDRVSFDKLISEKGREVLIEQALQCPCKGESVNQLSTCRNCGGTGWIFVNERLTRMIIAGMDVSTKYVAWSEEVRGTVSVTAMMEEQLSYLDKITVIDGKSIFGEVLNLRRSTAGVLFSYSAYDIKEIIYVGLFINDKAKLRQLETSDYTFTKNVFRLNSNITVDPKASVTIRYVHSPTFHIIEFKRETLQSFTLIEGNEQLIDLPISAYAKRAHYHMKPTNLTDDWLLNNDYEVVNTEIC